MKMFTKKKNDTLEKNVNKENDTQIISFNKIGKDDVIYGFNLTCRKLYHAKEDESSVDFSIDLINNDDIDLLIDMLSQLKKR